MRLKEHEIASIKRCAERHFGPNCAVRLFGSRADDGRRGGDIDLHVQLDDDAVSTMACRVRCLSDLEAALGDRKVDMVVEGPARKNGYIDRVAVLLAAPPKRSTPEVSEAPQKPASIFRPI